MKDMMKEFAKYAKEQFGYDISLKASSTPDTFESLFGASFIKQSMEATESCYSISCSR